MSCTRRSSLRFSDRERLEADPFVTRWASTRSSPPLTRLAVEPCPFSRPELRLASTSTRSGPRAFRASSSTGCRSDESEDVNAQAGRCSRQPATAACTSSPVPRGRCWRAATPPRQARVQREQQVEAFLRAHLADDDARRGRRDRGSRKFRTWSAARERIALFDRNQARCPGLVTSARARQMSAFHLGVSASG